MALIPVEEYRKMIGKGSVPKMDNPPPPPKKHKYNAKRTEVDGISFDSKKEAERYSALKLLENGRYITGLAIQVKFPLEGGSYIADFTYYDIELKCFVVEDTKGVRTSEYRFKKRAMKERYGIEILET